MNKWREIPRLRYWDQLEILPPACDSRLGFLRGEAIDAVDGKQRYRAFVNISDRGKRRFFESVTPMSISEFSSLRLYQVLGNVEEPTPNV